MDQTLARNAPLAPVGGDVATLVTRAEALCRTVASRDLGETPLYILPQSSLPPECGAGDHCYGFTVPSLDLYLAPHIPHYRGRAPCLVINDLALSEDFDPEDLEYLLPAYVLHELAHILERPALYQERRDADPDLIRFEALVVADTTARPPRNDLPAYFGHEQAFIRVALHVSHRAELAGFKVAPAVLCAGYRYGLSHAERYVESLGNEPEQMLGNLFRDILAIPPPAAFAALWAEDQRFYHERFPLEKGRVP